MILQRINPVLDRELRQRSRSARSMVLLSLFLALLIGVLYLAHAGNQASISFSSDPITALTSQVGRSMFEWVLTTMLVLLLFLVPGISSGSVAGERDRQTLIPLQVTLLGPVQIFLGKVLASSSFVLLLTVAAAPVLAVPYLVGGVSLGSVVRALVALLVVGVVLAVIGVACSAIFRRTQTATLAAYGMVLALTAGTLVLLAMLAVIDAQRGTDEIEARLVAVYANPFVAVADASGEVGSRATSPFSPIKQALLAASAGPDVEIVDAGVVIDRRTGERVDRDVGPGGVPIWVRSLLAQAAIAGLLALLGIRKLRAPQHELRS